MIKAMILLFFNVLSWDKQDVQISKNDPDWRGDFAGLIEKLDYIKALGFTAIWITPVVQNASGEDYHGYHSMDFSSVDLRYVAKPVEPEGITVYYDNSVTNWSNVKIHYWSINATTWPGVDMKPVADRANTYSFIVPTGTEGIVFNNGNGDQTDDITNPEHNHMYKGTGNRGWQDLGVVYSGISDVEFDEQAVEYYNMQGIRVDNPTNGFYIMRQGNKVAKVYIR